MADLFGHRFESGRLHFYFKKLPVKGGFFYITSNGIYINFTGPDNYRDTHQRLD